MHHTPDVGEIEGGRQIADDLKRFLRDPERPMILAILGISFLIFIHEWGHFYACRLTGTRTETFSIGFDTKKAGGG